MKLAILFLALAAGVAQAKVKSQLVEYKQGDTVLEGYLAYDDAVSGKRPGILVVHAWMGLDDNARKRADMLAQAGYVAFAADIYGKGVRPKDRDEAGKLAGQYKKDRALLRQRVAAGLAQLLKSPNVDANKTAAIGYCFGGTTVLELARSGAQVSGVVQLPRRARFAGAGRCQEHQEQGARAARRGRSVREARGLRRVQEGARGREGRLAARRVRRRGALLHRRDRR